MRSPDDMRALEAAINRGEIDANNIVAILGKTEGNGCVNDFTRAFAVRALRQTLAAHIDQKAVQEIAMVMSGGTEGALSPHMIVFETRLTAGDDATASFETSLALGRARTPVLASEHLGRVEQVSTACAPRWRMPASPILPTSTMCR
jgi:cyanuric acid amidohydrolase